MLVVNNMAKEALGVRLWNYRNWIFCHHLSPLSKDSLQGYRSMYTNSASPVPWADLGPATRMTTRSERNAARTASKVRFYAKWSSGTACLPWTCPTPADISAVMPVQISLVSFPASLWEHHVASASSCRAIAWLVLICTQLFRVRENAGMIEVGFVLTFEVWSCWPSGPSVFARSWADASTVLRGRRARCD